MSFGLCWRGSRSPAATESSSSAWEIEDRYSISWWDALIVAAAREQTCTILLTEDLQDGQVLAGVRVVSPFLNAPEKVLD